MRLIFVNRYFHPDHSATSQMLSDLAFAAAHAGHEVYVVTSRQRYDAPDEALPACEMVGGVAVKRIWTSRFGRSSLAGRAVDYLTFYVGAAGVLAGLARRGDVIIAKTDPPMLSLVAAPIAALRGACLVNWLQDVFPEVATALGWGRGRAGRLTLGLVRRFRDRSLRAAAMNIVVGERMAARISALGVTADRIRVVPNWADGGVIQPRANAENALRKAWVPDGSFVVGYSGNLGRAHDIDTVLGAMVALKAAVEAAPAIAQGRREPAPSPAIFWLFIGGGARFDELRRKAMAQGLGSVAFKPYQPQARLSESLSAADVHLVSLRPALEGLIVPSKFYGVAAAGRPTIFIGDPDGEIARTIARIDCGSTIAPGDGRALANAILDLAADPSRCQVLGRNVRRAFEQSFDKRIAVGRWLDVLHVLDRRRPAD